MKVKKPILWFTIVETVITVIIMGILIWVVFETYVVIWRIAVFIQAQKWIHNEVIYMTQIIQNLVDDQNVVLTWSSYSQLSLTKWFKNDLELIDDEFSYTFSRMCETRGCYINLEKKPIEFIIGIDTIINTPITNVWDVEVNQFVVKVLPFEEEDTFEKTMHEWFWLFLDTEAPHYEPEKWRFRVNYQGQLFFNPRKY